MIGTVLLDEERRQVVRYARRLADDGLAVLTAGNLSVRAGGQCAITPSGMAYEDLGPADVCVTDLDGRLADGLRQPSTELPMHLAVYRSTSAGAVTHTHSPYATALSTVVSELPAIHYLIADLGGPVPVVPYATPGSRELAEAVVAGLGERSAVLLQNHGTIAVGATLSQAYARVVTLEWLAEIYWRARLLGEPSLIRAAELDRVAQQLADYFTA